MENINWFDGLSAEGKFIIEIFFSNGGKAYMKNESYEKIVFYCTLLQKDPNCIGMTVYNPDGKIVENNLSKAA